jgi:hypothetical protein
MILLATGSAGTPRVVPCQYLSENLSITFQVLVLCALCPVPRLSSSISSAITGGTEHLDRTGEADPVIMTSTAGYSGCRGNVLVKLKFWILPRV